MPPLRPELDTGSIEDGGRIHEVYDQPLSALTGATSAPVDRPCSSRIGEMIPRFDPIAAAKSNYRRDLI